MTRYAYECTIRAEAWEQSHVDVNLVPYLIRMAQEKAGTTDGEWYVRSYFDPFSFMGGPGYRVCVEQRGGAR